MVGSAGESKYYIASSYGRLVDNQDSERTRESGICAVGGLERRTLPEQVELNPQVKVRNLGQVIGAPQAISRGVRPRSLLDPICQVGTYCVQR
jgi:hypothetical protein